MGHHINKKGQFQSDRHPDLAPDKMVLSFKDPVARDALNYYALNCEDDELSKDILTRVDTITTEAGHEQT